MPVSTVPPIDAVRTRLLTRQLLRPWGADVPEMHLVVVEVDAGGATGVGFSWTPTIGPYAVQALLDHDIAAFAVGRPAHPELLWDDAWLHLHEAGGGGLTTIALAGLDLALWDLRAGPTGTSVGHCIGRRTDRLPAYGSGVNLHYSLDELVAQAERWVAAGYRGAKIKVGSPDLTATWSGWPRSARCSVRTAGWPWTPTSAGTCRPPNARSAPCPASTCSGSRSRCGPTTCSGTRPCGNGSRCRWPAGRTSTPSTGSRVRGRGRGRHPAAQHRPGGRHHAVPADRPAGPIQLTACWPRTCCPTCPPSSPRRCRVPSGWKRSRTPVWKHSGS